MKSIIIEGLDCVKRYPYDNGSSADGHVVQWHSVAHMNDHEYVSHVLQNKNQLRQVQLGFV